MSKGSEHVLLTNAFVYEKEVQELDPPASRYDTKLGYWLWTDGEREQVLVNSSNPAKPLAATKKADRETGEDQKRK